jgi:hypothetical protein
MDNFCVLPWFGRELNWDSRHDTHCCLLPKEYDIKKSYTIWCVWILGSIGVYMMCSVYYCIAHWRAKADQTTGQAKEHMPKLIYCVTAMRKVSMQASVMTHEQQETIKSY